MHVCPINNSVDVFNCWWLACWHAHSNCRSLLVHWSINHSVWNTVIGVSFVIKLGGGACGERAAYKLKGVCDGQSLSPRSITGSGQQIPPEAEIIFVFYECKWGENLPILWSYEAKNCSNIAFKRILLRFCHQHQFPSTVQRCSLFRHALHTQQ